MASNQKYGRNSRAPSNKGQAYRTAANKQRRILRAKKDRQAAFVKNEKFENIEPSESKKEQMAKDARAIRIWKRSKRLNTQPAVTHNHRYDFSIAARLLSQYDYQPINTRIMHEVIQSVQKRVVSA